MDHKHKMKTYCLSLERQLEDTSEKLQNIFDKMTEEYHEKHFEFMETVLSIQTQCDDLSNEIQQYITKS